MGRGREPDRLLRNSFIKDLTEGKALNFFGKNADELSEFFEFLKEAYFSENSKLKSEFETLAKTNSELKAGDYDVSSRKNEVEN